MDWLIWGGAALSLAGLAGIVASILKVQRARRAGLSDEDLRARIQSVLPLNLGAFFASILGLMAVVVGVLL
ncbi:hypothetical protein [Histidinibacterium lentulum]|uniref:Uncharacterized protein n=1 Tax=Histidinibacterium lentulum TaxID=2480588 RepID=A0A3N2QTW4_9RHOB|nr:hypothetical protein [Histidinibacterium lentulum]ROT98485.1 hypothetical protein EAT49_16210 [Histidinibacterium lentulum]